MVSRWDRTMALGAWGSVPGKVAMALPSRSICTESVYFFISSAEAAGHRPLEAGEAGGLHKLPQDRSHLLFVKHVRTPFKSRVAGSAPIILNWRQFAIAPVFFFQHSQLRGQNLDKSAACSLFPRDCESCYLLFLQFRRFDRR